MNTIVPRQDFYVYILRRNGIPFYIGKGRENRLEQHFICAKRRASCKHLTCRVIRKEWREGGEITSEKVCEDVFEQTAFRVECLMIRVGIASSWPLVNQTLGGEGLSGYKHPPEIQAKIKATRLRNLTPEKRAEYGQFSKQMWSNSAFREKQMKFLTSPAFQEARLRGTKAIKNYKTYEGFIAPDGTIYAPVTNISAFCKEHSLNSGALYRVHAGKQEHYQGWKRYYKDSEPPKRKPRPSPYSISAFISPGGTIYTDIPNFTRFCHEHGLERASMYAVNNEQQTHHKGWTSYPPKLPVHINNTYHFLSPEGEIFTFNEGFNTFCKEHGLNKGEISRLHRGIAKSHKGWTRYVS